MNQSPLAAILVPFYTLPASAVLFACNPAHAAENCPIIVKVHHCPHR